MSSYVNWTLIGIVVSAEPVMVAAVVAFSAMARRNEVQESTGIQI